MREVDFYQLPRHVQERFVTSSRGAGLPSWLLSCQPPRPYPWLWTVLGAAGLLVVCGASVVGFGALGSPRAIMGPAAIIIFAVGFVAALLGLLYASAQSSVAERLHYKAGIYLYPVGVIDAMTAMPRVYPLTDLSEVTGSQPARKLTLRFAGGTTFEFDAETEARAADIEQQIRRYQAELGSVQNDPRELAALDPLTDSGVPNPLLSTIRLVRNTPWWVRFAVPLSIAVGAALGAGVWSLRNTLSDRRMYGKATKADTVEGFRAYLQARGRQPSVQELWLPRAELRRARGQGTVEAIEQFADQHPNSQIAGEIAQAMQQALLAELARAKATGQVAPLRAITRHRKYRLIAPELAAAIHETYQAALKRFQSDAVDGSTQLQAFMGRLLNYAEEHGPTVQVRFRRQPSSSVQIMEDQVKRSPYASKEHLPGQYFDATHDTARAGKLAELLIARWQRQFPPDMLHFARGPELTGDPAQVDAPTLAVKHTTLMTGAATMNKPRGVFVSISVAFEASFALPGEKKPLSFQYRRASAPDIKAMVAEELSPEALYDRMTDKCYGDFARAYLGSLFKKP
jgi:hypothetical protein